jgi:hypothetical protein
MLYFIILLYLAKAFHKDEASYIFLFLKNWKVSVYVFKYLQANFFLIPKPDSKIVHLIFYLFIYFFLLYFALLEYLNIKSIINTRRTFERPELQCTRIFLRRTVPESNSDQKATIGQKECEHNTGRSLLPDHDHSEAESAENHRGASCIRRKAEIRTSSIYNRQSKQLLCA